MRKYALMGVVIALWGAVFVYAQEFPELPQPVKAHEWLTQLEGEWEYDAEMYMEGQEPLKTKGTEEVRAIGGFWILAENKADFMGQPFTGLLTLGYDVEEKQYVGTWADSMSGYLWKYEGSLDETGKVLTLNTSGPCPAKPGTHSKFKEVLEVKSPDRKVFTSSIQNEDGEWMTMMKIDYRRKK